MNYFHNYKIGPVIKQTIQQFYLTRFDLHEIALKFFANAPDYNSAKPSSLAYSLINELAEVMKLLPSELKSTVKSHLTDNHRMVAFNFFQVNATLFTIAIDLYDLRAAREIFVGPMREMLTVNKFKEVCQIAQELDLQQHFGIHDFLMPLVLQDKLSVVEAYLARTPPVATDLVIFLDSWLDHSRAFHSYYDLYQGERYVPEVNCTKLQRKTFKKLVKRYADLYQVPRQQTPNLIEMDSYGMLKTLIRNKYVEQRLSENDFWEEFIKERVSHSAPTLITELINSCIDYDDYPEAAKWVKYFEEDPDKYSDQLKDFMDASPNLQASSVAKAPEAIDYYCVAREKIHMVADLESYLRLLDKMMRYKLLAFDCEWKFGDTDVSLIQIASSDWVCLVDVKTLAACIPSSEWRRLGRKLFNNDDIIKLGFSQDGDMAVLKKALPSLGLHYEKSNSYIDLKKLWTFMRDTVRYRFLNEVQVAGKEGLQQLVAAVLGRPLNKNQQFSNWSRRPLFENQILYAANDAYCLLEIYQKFNAAATKRGFDLTNYELLKKLK